MKHSCLCSLFDSICYLKCLAVKESFKLSNVELLFGDVIEYLKKTTNKFDVILNMEIVEHVEDVQFFLKSCSGLLKKNGLMFVATINKTLKSYMFAIVGAEYILRWLPIGTHEWEKFVKPEELKKILIKNNLKLEKLDGMNFNIIKDEWSVSTDTSVNYIAKFIKV